MGFGKAELDEIKQFRRERAAGGDETAFRKYFRRDLHDGLVRNLRKVGLLTERITPSLQSFGIKLAALGLLDRRLSSRLMIMMPAVRPAVQKTTSSCLYRRLLQPLKQLVAHDGVVLRDLDDARIFLDRQALVLDGLGHGVAGFVGQLGLLVGRRLDQLLLVAVPDGRHVLDRLGRGIELLLGNVCPRRRSVGLRRGRRRLRGAWMAGAEEPVAAEVMAQKPMVDFMLAFLSDDQWRLSASRSTTVSVGSG